MKKLLLTLIVSLAFCGSIFAQEYTSHWSDFNDALYADNTGFVVYVQIDGAFVTSENFAQMEVAAYVGDECRGPIFLLDETDLGDYYPAGQLQVNFNTPGEVVSFRLYDHAQGIEYKTCTPIDYTTLEPLVLKTGEWHDEVWSDPDHSVVLSFTSPSYTIEIDAYTDAKDNYYLIASPIGAVNAELVDGLMDPDYDLYAYSQNPDDDGNEWINHRGEADFTLQPGYGYLYANNTGTDLVFHGNGIAEGSFDVVLDYVTDNPDFPNDSWNLLGNPFCEDATIGDEKPFYRMIDGGLQPQDAGAPIPAMEGFFVTAQGEETITINLANSSKTNPMLALNLSNGGKVLDRAIVSFGQGQQLPKFQLFNNSNVYIPMDGRDYALVRSEGMGEMPVNFKAESNGTYSLTLSSENVDFAYLHLIDNMTGADQDLLANPSYSFSANTTDYASRFRLVFATGNAEDNFAFFSNGNLVINNEGNATLQVVDVTGRIIKCENINGCASVSINAAPGVYMVRLINGDNMKVQKVVK